MNLSRALLCVLALTAAGPAWADDAPPKLEALTKAFESADYKQVVALAEQVAAESPDRAKAQYLAGEAFLVLGDPAQAETCFRAVLELRPKAVPAQVGLGTALTQREQHEEAVKVLEAAVAAEPKDAAASRALAVALLASGKTEDGTKRLEAAAKAAPKDAATARALAEARLRANDSAGAKQVGERLLKDLPKHPMGDFLVALALDREGEDKKAIEAYEKALAKDDTFLDAHKNLAILCHVKSNTYQDQERVKKAFAHYARYFELGGADARLKQMYDTMKAYFEQNPGAPGR